MLHATLSISEVLDRFSCTSLSRKSLPTRLVCYAQLYVFSYVARYGERSRVILLTKMPRLTTYICITHPGIGPRETAYLKHHQSCVFPI